jgi:hypothetical protein
MMETKVIEIGWAGPGELPQVANLFPAELVVSLTNSSADETEGLLRRARIVRP